MKAKQSFSHTKAQKLGFAALLGFLLLPVVFLALLRSNSHQLAILSLQFSIRAYVPLSTVEEPRGSEQSGADVITSLPSLKGIQERNDSVVGKDKEVINLPIPYKDKLGGNNSNAGTEITKVPLHLKEKQGENKSIVGAEKTKLPPDLKEEQDENTIVVDNNGAELFHASSEKPEQNHTTGSVKSYDESGVSIEMTKLPLDMKEKQGENKSIVVTETTKLPHDLKEKQDENKTVVGNSLVQESKLVCDLSEPRSDTCFMLGDIRILSQSSTIFLALPSQPRISTENSTWKIRPYARKWELPVMQQISEISLMSSPDSKNAPRCTVNHTVPAVIFSTGGFLGNFFHDFTDVLVPLFVTSRQFQGEVQFLVTDFNSKWIDKYQQILRQLSRYEIINMDTDMQVHCFPEAHVGLKSHKVLGIDPSKTPNGYSMIDFKQFLRSCFSLKKGYAKKIARQSRKKPRLLIVLRKGSRSLTNAKEVVAMARAIGYKVVTAGQKDTKDLARFALVVNSCDVMMGVHGAGLANMVFLPANATVIQIIPWGGLKWACRHDFGEPAPDMGLNYVEYEIKEEESSLIEEYPRDHAVFKDPISIHRQGWNALWSIFLDKQNVKLDVGRFRGVLLEVYQSLKQ